MKLVLAGVLGLVLGAAIVGGAWAFTAAGSPGKASTGGGTGGSITPPPRLGAYQQVADLDLYRSDKGKANLERIQSWNQQSAKRLSESYGGADARLQSYADAGLDSQFTLQIVRASTPFPPYVPYQDPQVLGIARPSQEVLRFGQVACVVQNDVVVAGQNPGPESVHVLSCLRTGPGRTITIGPVTGSVGHRPQEVAALVDEAWTKLA
jgi:hypothetical protein